MALHLQPVFNTADVYGDGKPTRIAFSDRDLRQGRGTLPVSEALADRCMGIPWFKKMDAKRIDEWVAAYKKVALQAEALK
jgi:dTDP-4-amino-4,6-dideoxygalactose transaminase